MLKTKVFNLDVVDVLRSWQAIPISRFMWPHWPIATNLADYAAFLG
jgi:hypothetical protein